MLIPIYVNKNMIYVWTPTITLTFLIIDTHKVYDDHNTQKAV